MRAIDLFCGAGGMSIGLVEAGFNVVGAVDSWDPAVATHRANFDHLVLQADLSDLDANQLLAKLGRDSDDPIDLVVGGPPCQGFSIQRIGPDNDERNSLVLDFARLSTGLEARYVLMENVLGLTGRRGKPLLREYVRRLEEGGYEVQVERVDAADFGVPQRRQRVIVMAWRRGESFLDLPTTSQCSSRPTVWDAIGDLPTPARHANPTTDPLHIQSRLSDLNRKRLTFIPPGGGFEDLPKELRVDCHRNGASKIGHRNVYGRLAPDKPAVTITARFDSFTRGKFAHPFENRNITLREGARLQTFPDDFAFEGNREEIAAQIGNAVPPLLATALASAVADRIRSPHSPSSATQPRLL